MSEGGDGEVTGAKGGGPGKPCFRPSGGVRDRRQGVGLEGRIEEEGLEAFGTGIKGADGQFRKQGTVSPEGKAPDKAETCRGRKPL
jgi:hypothetical protein